MANEQKPKVLVIPGHKMIAPDRPGRGAAYCECGENSTSLASGNYRREWHRRHKEEIYNNG